LLPFISKHFFSSVSKNVRTEIYKTIILLNVFGDRVLGRIFGLKRDEII
jgi:hypothetical protein